MADNIVLTYFDGRGLGECVRLTLAAAGLKWTEIYLKEAEQVDKLRKDGLLLFEQVPLLQWNGQNFVQSLPTVREIGRRSGLLGQGDDQYKVDMLTNGARDFQTAFMKKGFAPDEDLLKGIDTSVPRYMGAFEKVLSGSKSGFLVGTALTIADVALLEVLLMLEEEKPGAFQQYPKCKTFLEFMKSQPKIKEYLNGPQRHPPNSPAYVVEVKKVLRW